MKAHEKDRLEFSGAEKQITQQRVIKANEFANRAARRAIVRVAKQIKKKGGLE